MAGENTRFKRHIRPLAPVVTGVVPDLSKMQRYEAMLFDVYGTLLVSGAGEIGLNRVPIERDEDLQGLLNRYDVDFTPQTLLEKLNRAIETAHLIGRYRGIAFPEVDIIDVWQKVLGSDDTPRVKGFAMEYELIVNPVYPMPGLADLLAACKKQGLPTGIISNAQFYTVDLLELFLGEPLGGHVFDRRLLFFSWREKHAKPSTFMFNRAKAVLAGMGIPAFSVLYVGNDMRNDILPARSVGFRTALFAGDRRSLRQRRSEERCRDLSPDLTVTDLRQLIPGTGNH